MNHRIVYSYAECIDLCVHRKQNDATSAALELLRAFHSHTFEITKYSFTQIITLITGGLVFVHRITKTTARKGFSEFYFYLYFYFIFITIIIIIFYF